MARSLRPFEMPAPSTAPTSQQYTKPTMALGAPGTLARMRSLATQAGGIYTQGTLPALLGRSKWTYQSVVSAPRMGPPARLAYGSGQTGASDDRRTGIQPSYVSDYEYHPAPFDYEPGNSPQWLQRIPMAGPFPAFNGRDIVGTYQPHDFAVAQYMYTHSRRADNWQVMSFPPDWRNLIGAQQVSKYQPANLVASARPLQQNDYFLGYQMSMLDGVQFGASGMGRPLGN